MAKGGFFKNLKKKITLKGVIRTVAGAAAAIPIVGGAIQSAAENLTAAKDKAKQAAAEAQANAAQGLANAAASGQFSVPSAGPQPAGFIDTKNPVLWVAVGLGVLLLLKRR